MPAPETPPATPAEEARATDTQDGGWSVESFSAPSDPPPADTTAEPRGIDNPPPAAAHPAEGEHEGEDDDESAETVATAAPTRERDEATGQFKPAAAVPGKKSKSAQARIDEIRRQAGDADRRAAAAEQRAQDLAARLDAIEKAGRPAVADPAPAPAPVAAVMPEHPKYADFETDEAYQTAVGKWRTDVTAWQTAREERLKQDLTGTLDERLKKDRDTADRQAHETQVAARMTAMRTAHPDFAEKIAANAETLSQIQAPFLQDLITNTPDGAEFLYDLASAPDMAQALGALPLPTRPLADAVRQSPAVRMLMKHFATEIGREDFSRLRLLHPIDVIREVGKLEARLETAERGPAPVAVHSITNVVPPAKPPAGSPRARDSQSSGAPEPFDEWMAAEDKRERDQKIRAAGGVPVSV